MADTTPDPTVGRTVHFAEWDNRAQSIVPRAAIVTGTGPDADNGIVNLFVLTPSRSFHLIGVHQAAELKENCWSWPPRG